MTEEQGVALLGKFDELIAAVEGLQAVTDQVLFVAWVAVHLLSMLAAWRVLFWWRMLCSFFSPSGK